MKDGITLYIVYKLQPRLRCHFDYITLTNAQEGKAKRATANVAERKCIYAERQWFTVRNS